jgi:hypothetical protein
MLHAFSVLLIRVAIGKITTAKEGDEVAILLYYSTLTHGSMEV